MTPLISVVVPTCGRADLLARCLDRLAPGAQALAADQYEVLVSDDGDPTVEELVAAEYPWASWAAGPRRGPAANRNAGARRARAEWLAFTDDDCVPGPNWLVSFANVIHPGCHVYEGKTTCVAGIHSALEHAPINIHGGWLWSCNFLLRRSTFEEVGGFDEAFPYPAMEDVDLRQRLVVAGYPFEFVPEAVVDHPPRRLASGRKLAQQHESWVYYWYKHGNRGVTLPRMLFDITRRRLIRIGQNGLNKNALLAIGSLTNELGATLVRAPLWEWTYRRRFRSIPKR